MSHTLTPAITNILELLPAAIEHTLKHEAACQVLVAQCTALATQIDGARRRIAQERAAQKVLRAEIAAFLRERGERRSCAKAIDCSLEGSVVLEAGNVSITVEKDVSMCSDNNNSLYQESPLCLKSKRKGRVFDDDMEILPKRRRLTVDSGRSRL
ncbi:hypothetical protein C2E23DRAFT_882267 [Lenzites betulinus]|nr:hypothetical protein C2E23DRAFT_882267 [Lenzites betulinus]